MTVLKTEIGAGRRVFREGTLYSWTVSHLEGQKMLPGNKAGLELDLPTRLEAIHFPGTRLGE